MEANHILLPRLWPRLSHPSIWSRRLMRGEMRQAEHTQLHTPGRFWTPGSLPHCVTCLVSLPLNFSSDGRESEHRTHVMGPCETPLKPRLSGIFMEMQGKMRRSARCLSSIPPDF